MTLLTMPAAGQEAKLARGRVRRNSCENLAAMAIPAASPIPHAASAPSAPSMQASRPQCSVVDEVMSDPQMSEWARGYLSLLAESSSSPGRMQTHLTRLVAKGVTDAAMVYSLAHNPAKYATDQLAQHGVDTLLKKWMSFRSYTVDPEEAEQQRKKAEQDQKVANAVHSKVLACLLSMMMTGTATAAQDMAIDALAQAGVINPTEAVKMHNGGAIALVLAAAPSVSASDVASAASGGTSMIQRASDVVNQAAHDPASIKKADEALGSVLGPGGMAASTALRLLRADSKRSSIDGVRPSGPSMDGLRSSGPSAVLRCSSIIEVAEGHEAEPIAPLESRSTSLLQQQYHHRTRRFSAQPAQQQEEEPKQQHRPRRASTSSKISLKDRLFALAGKAPKAAPALV